MANQFLLIFIKRNVWYSWSLKILAIKRWFRFSQKNKGLSFNGGGGGGGGGGGSGGGGGGGGVQKLQTFTRYFFWYWYSKTFLSSLLQVSCACYLVDFGDNQWFNEMT